MSTYLNLGTNPDEFHPLPTDVQAAQIRTNLKLGSASLLTGTVSGSNPNTSIRLGDGTNFVDITGSGSSAARLTTPRTFTLSGILTSTPVYFDGSSNVTMPVISISDNAITQGKILDGSVSSNKLSTGHPSWDSSGNITLDGSSITLFSSASTISRAIGVNSDLIINNTGSGNIKFQTNGSNDRFVINGSGNIGIGVSIPTSPLHIATATPGTSAISINASTTVNKRAAIQLGNWNIRQDVSLNNTFDFSIFDTGSPNTSRFYIGTDGKVGIGTISPSTTLTVVGDVTATTFIGALTGSASGNIVKGCSGPLIIGSGTGNGAGDMTLIANGTSYGTTWPISISGDVNNGTITPAKLSAGHPTWDGGGNLSATGDIIAYSSSDKKFKDNIVNITNPLEKLLQINGVTFDWNDKQSTHIGHDIGVIAQEVEAVLPEIVTTREDGSKAVKYDKIVALLIECIKELKCEIEELKTQVK